MLLFYLESGLATARSRAHVKTDHVIVETRKGGGSGTSETFPWGCPESLIYRLLKRKKKKLYIILMVPTVSSVLITTVKRKPDFANQDKQILRQYKMSNFLSPAVTAPAHAKQSLDLPLK